MNEQLPDRHIRILVADDDEHILECYRDAFTAPEPTGLMRKLDMLEAELFDPNADISEAPVFDFTACSQGEQAVDLVKSAHANGKNFDVVILDIRMPPGINGVEAGRMIRQIDPEVEIVFVSGYSDVPMQDLMKRVPPPSRLHCFNKPLSFMQLAQDVANMVRAA